MDDTLKKIKRVEGQVSGIRKMVEEGRECLDVVQQIVAARSALSGVAKDLLKEEASECAKTDTGQKKFDRILKSLLDV